MSTVERTYTAAEVDDMSLERKLRLYAVLSRRLTQNIKFDVQVISRSQAAWVLDEITEGGGTYNSMRSEAVLDLIERALDHKCHVRVGREGSPVVYIKPHTPANDKQRLVTYHELASMADAAYADEISLNIHDRTEAWYRDDIFEPTEKALEFVKSMCEKYPDRDSEWTPNFMTELRLWWD